MHFVIMLSATLGAHVHNSAHFVLSAVYEKRETLQVKERSCAREQPRSKASITCAEPRLLAAAYEHLLDNRRLRGLPFRELASLTMSCATCYAVITLMFLVMLE